jgi:hypothetical protein
VSGRPTAAELVETPGALLTSSHLAELGLSRRAIDSVFRHCPIVQLPDFHRPMIRAEDYRALVEASMHDGQQVWPPRPAP